MFHEDILIYSSSTTGVYPSYTPTTKFPTYRPTTARPVVVTVPTTRPTQPPYLGPPTYKPTYKPGFHLTPTPLPQFPTTSTTTKSTTPNPYRPTFKPAVLATFKPTLPWFSTTPKDEETTTPRYTLPTYPFPILPQFDPSTTTSSNFLVAEMITTTTSTTTTAIPPTESTTEPSSIGIAGLPDSVGLPSSPEAFIFYLETLVDQISDITSGILPFVDGDGSSQDEYEVQSFAAASTVIGLPLVTGLMSLLGVGPAIIIGLSWLAPLILMLAVPSLAG